MKTENGSGIHQDQSPAPQSATKTSSTNARPCQWCGVKFKPYRANQRYCPGGSCKASAEKHQRELAKGLEKGKPGKVSAAAILAKRKHSFTTTAERQAHSRKMNEARRLKKMVEPHDLELAETLEVIAKALRQGRIFSSNFDGGKHGEERYIQVQYAHREVK